MAVNFGNVVTDPADQQRIMGLANGTVSRNESAPGFYYQPGYSHDQSLDQTAYSYFPHYTGSGTGLGTAGSTGTGAGAPGAAPSAPAYGTFTPPDPNNPLTDPTLKFRLSQGTQAIQNGAAARGTLLTGATSKALNDYAQNEAATGYQQAYGNALSTYDTNRDTSQGNFGNNMATFNGNLGANGQAQGFSLSSRQLADQENNTQFDRSRTAWLDAGGYGPLYGGYQQPGAPQNYRTSPYASYTYGQPNVYNNPAGGYQNPPNNSHPGYTPPPKPSWGYTPQGVL
jgi:hypothetical protein